MRFRCLLPVLCLVVLPVVAGEPSRPLGDDFLRDYALTRGFMAGRPTGAEWLPDGDAVLFLRSQPRSRSQQLWHLELASGRLRELGPAVDLRGAAGADLSDAERARRERLRITAGGFTSFSILPGGREVLAPLGSELWRFRLDSGEGRRVPIGDDFFDTVVSPDGRSLGFVRAHEVWVHDLRSGRERPVTRGATEDITHGEAEFVAAEEMGRTSGWWWSPDSRHLAYQVNDARDVEIWHVADPAHPDRTPRAQRYPRPGRPNVDVRLAVTSIRGGRPRWIEWDRARLPYLAAVQWTAAGGLVLTVQSRDQRELQVLKADPASGRTTRLVEETDPLWINLDPAMPKWLRDGSGFLWTTERAGAWQVELRRPDGALDRVIVPPDPGFHGVLHLDEERGELVVARSSVAGSTGLWRVPLAGGPATALVEETGVHTGIFAARGGRWIHIAATPGGMPTSVIREADGREVRALPSVAEEPGVAVDATLVTLAEEPGFVAQVLRPSGFEPGRKYPVWLSVYGGPGANVVQSSLRSRLLAQWAADQGFVVVSVDNRGTPGRGRAWEREIHGRMLELPVQDQAAALHALGRQIPELDLQRVGIVGWSFGGYLSAGAVLKRPDAFHAAVAGAPVTDWWDYDTHYTERYLGVPGSSDSVYEANSLLPLAAGLQRPLLLIHGTSDDNVYFRHSLRLSEALFRAGRPFELLPLPGLTHMVPDPEMMQRQWRRTAEFLQTHLR